MKRLFLLSAMFIFSLYTKAQRTTSAGDIYVGVQGSYITSYHDFLGGIRGAYHFSNPFQLNLAFSMNPWIRYNEDNNSKFDIQIYNIDLNGHFYIINRPNWGMAPVAGLGYYYLHEKRIEGIGSYDGRNNNKVGLNLGWDIRYEFAQTWRISAFWKYTFLSDDESHHTLGVAVGYHFNAL